MILVTKVRLIRIRFLLFVLVLFPYKSLAQQSSEEIKNIFAQAEAYYLYEEYELANQLYLLIDNPVNMNIKFKIGNCYLNIASEKEKSIPFLEAAVKTASIDSKTDSYKELRAPLDVYFFLGKAYMINNEMDKGLSTLQAFKRLIAESKGKGQMQNVEFVDQQIQACKNAISYKLVPIDFTKQSLGSSVNIGSINDNPVVSFDGNTLAFTERRGIVNAIYCSKKENGIWQPPQEITAALKAGVDCSTCSLNSDGTELFLYKIENYDGSIYSSLYKNGQWSPIKKLNKNINTKFYESHASISNDGKKLYFTSNRDGGQGNLDIYVSKKEENGDWGPAENLGPTINTPFNEDTPFITRNDSVLFFSSEGHNSMGGYDMFKSLKKNEGWNAPNNLGFPINSADDDKALDPANNGRNAYYTMTTAYKKKEIFYLNFDEADNNMKYKVSGKFLLNDSVSKTEIDKNIKVINKITGDTLSKGLADRSTGMYSVNVAPGILRIFYSSYGYLTKTVDTIIVKDSPDLIVNLDVSLPKDTVKKPEPVYEKIDLKAIPTIVSIDSSILIKNMKVSDVSNKKIADSEVLYYTVQVIALHKPVDISYFKYISDMKVMYNDDDKFYRYTTGNFQTKEAGYEYRLKLIKKGYPNDIFVKKISR